MLRYRTQGLLAVGLGMLAGGCFGDPEINSDLRPAGPPEVLAALGQSTYELVELPFYCKYVGGTKDEKAPGFAIDAVTGGGVVCPDAESEFEANPVDPRGFALRVMFDELLNGDRVESLICDDDGLCVGSLATTQPVTVTCGASNTEVAYDGYYVPNGNNTTFPLGPSLYILPDPAALVFPTGSDCTVSMGDNVVDKAGETVPADQRDVDFSIADLALLATDPEDAEDAADRAVLAGTDALAFVFNAAMDDASVSATDIQILNSADAAQTIGVVADGYNVPGDALYVFGDPYLIPGEFTAKIASGAELAEVNGGTVSFSADESVRFSVTYGVIDTVPADGDEHAAADDIEITLNGNLVAASVTAAELSLQTADGTDVAFTFTVTNDTIVINPTANLAPGDYVVSIVQDASFDGPTAGFPAEFADALEVAFTVPAP